MDTLLQYSTYLVPIVTSIISAYFLMIRKDNKKKKLYYEEIIIPFVCEYKKNCEMDTLQFFEDKIVRNKTFIPHYIFYLFENKNKEDLNKVLIYDYLELSDNNMNRINNFISVFSDSLYYILTIIIFLVFCFTIMLIIGIIILIVSDIWNNDFSNLRTETFTPIILFILLILLIRFITYYFKINDRYTISMKHISRIIDTKKKKYSKIIVKYYFDVKTDE